jgi:hypothetical protein
MKRLSSEKLVDTIVTSLNGTAARFDGATGERTPGIHGSGNESHQAGKGLDGRARTKTKSDNRSSRRTPKRG